MSTFIITAGTSWRREEGRAEQEAERAKGEGEESEREGQREKGLAVGERGGRGVRGTKRCEKKKTQTGRKNSESES